MTQTEDNTQRVSEFNALFTNLSENGKEEALSVLQTLGFAQAVMLSQNEKGESDPTKHIGTY